MFIYLFCLFITILVLVSGHLFSRPLPPSPLLALLPSRYLVQTKQQSLNSETFSIFLGFRVQGLDFLCVFKVWGLHYFFGFNKNTVATKKQHSFADSHKEIFPPSSLLYLVRRWTTQPQGSTTVVAANVAIRTMPVSMYTIFSSFLAPNSPKSKNIPFLPSF